MKKVKEVSHLNNLGAFLAEARASSEYKKDLDLIMATYGYSQLDVAKEFGVCQQSVSKWLRGKVKPKCLIAIHLTAEGLRKQP